MAVSKPALSRGGAAVLSIFFKSFLRDKVSKEAAGFLFSNEWPMPGGPRTTKISSDFDLIFS